MIEQAVALALTFLVAWGGRDRVWHPTFEAAGRERFALAMEHYRERMGFQEEFAWSLDPGEHCARVRLVEVRVPGFEVQEVVEAAYRGGAWCDGKAPEFWALHEACHLRMMHHRGAGPASRKDREREVETCMGWYSEKWRR